MVRSRCRLVSGTLNNSERAPSSGPPTEAYPQAPAGGEPSVETRAHNHQQAPAGANPTAAIHGTLRWSFYSLREHLCYRQVPPRRPIHKPRQGRTVCRNPGTQPSTSPVRGEPYGRNSRHAPMELHSAAGAFLLQTGASYGGLSTSPGRYEPSVGTRAHNHQQAPAGANRTAATHGTLRWSFDPLDVHLCYRQVPPDGHTDLSKRALPPCQTVELIGASGLPARRHTRLSVALARAMVIALRELFLQPGVQHDEEISAPHLLQLQLRFAGCAIGPRDWKLRECIAAHDGLQR